MDSSHWNTVRVTVGFAGLDRSNMAEAPELLPTAIPWAVLCARLAAGRKPCTTLPADTTGRR
jgi:hypothetical protein